MTGSGVVIVRRYLLQLKSTLLNSEWFWPRIFQMNFQEEGSGGVLSVLPYLLFLGSTSDLNQPCERERLTQMSTPLIVSVCVLTPCNATQYRASCTQVIIETAWHEGRVRVFSLLFTIF